MSVPCFPNLPCRTVRTVLCGDHPVVRRSLEERGIEVITLDSSFLLPAPVSDHADMICCHASLNTVVTSDAALAEFLRRRGVDCRVACTLPGDRYPFDCALNCLVTDTHAVCRADIIAPELTDIFAAKSTEIVHVRQGYARCSVATVDDHSFITADRGIAAAMEAKGYDVLLISPGGIILEGYDTGFIGGCCGKLSADRMLFCGSPARHPDGKRILGFLAARGITAECTHDDALVDFGGFITLFE